MVLRKLAISNFTARKWRVALTVAAIALSVSLVVSVTSGYASAEAAAFKYLAAFMGAHDATISRGNGVRGTVDEKIVEELRRDPEVKDVVTRFATDIALIDSTGKPLPPNFHPAQVVGVHRPLDKRVESMKLHEGAWFDSDEGDVAVVDQAAARVLKNSANLDENSPSLHVGDTFELPGPHGNLRLKIVGIVHKPAILANTFQTIYLPFETLRKHVLGDQPAQVTRAMIDLKEGVNDHEFSQRWTNRLAELDPTLKLRTTGESRDQMATNLQSLHVLSYMGGMVSMLAASFIVFSSLSMGVSERQRTLAMLRAIGAHRAQLGMLVVLEGTILSAVGALIGLPLGLLWVLILSWIHRTVFAAGVVVSWGGVAFAVLASVGAALIASFLPAWNAMRTDPLEAMSPLAKPQAVKGPLLWSLAGLLLISIDPFLVFAPLPKWAGTLGARDPVEFARQVTFFGHFVLGLPGLMIGFFLLAPLFVWVTEKVFGPIIAAMFGLQYSMLRQQLSGGIKRAAGTAAALMVGLATLVVLQAQGNTALNGWQLPTHFPDIFITAFFGLNKQQTDKLAHTPGIKPGELMPIAIASPEYGSNLMNIGMATVMPNATMFFGVDPDLAFQMMELEFREGDPKSATEALKKGRHLVVTEEFRQLKGLKIGDKLSLKTARHGIVDYTVAGVVWSPGIDVMVISFDLGPQFDTRTAASVFGSVEDAREDFGVESVYLFAANLEPGLERKQLIQKVQQSVGALGMNAYDVRQIKHEITEGLRKLLLVVSTVAFAAMAVASLGVTNTIMASIRSRQWQFGILRSIGVTRSGLLRLVLAEAVLLGIVGCALGLAAGMLMFADAHELGRLVLGYKPPASIPWGFIAIGVGIVMLISVIASLGPAIGVSRCEPLDLLQAGRAAA